MKYLSYLILVCCLLLFSCTKKNVTPEDEEPTNGGTYFEATISGPKLSGDFKWDGAYIQAMEDNNRAGIFYGFGSDMAGTLKGGFTVLPGTGSHKVMADNNQNLFFEVAARGFALTQLDMTVNVTSYTIVKGSGELRLIDRIYGTFEGTTQTLAQTADQESGIVHNVKGKFGYSLQD